MFKKFVLDNGLRIITVPLKAGKTVTVLILVGTGSKYETKETNGISHFLEHMFFKGTEKRPTPMVVVKELDRIGGEYNAFTSKEVTGYFVKVDHQHLDLALDWLADIFLNSKLDEQEIEREKGVIIEEINTTLDTPMRYVEHLWEDLLYNGQPAGWFVWGSKETVSQFKRKQFVEYLNQHYTASNTVICIAGNFIEKGIVSKIEEFFKGLRVGKPREKPPVIEDQSAPSSLLYYKKTDQAHLCLGVRGYNIFHPDKYALNIIGVILGGYLSSRLFQEIREKRGLAYYIRTSVETNTDSGYLVTQAGVANNKIEEAITAIIKEYRKIRDEDMKEEELLFAKEHIKGNMMLNLETSDEIASFFANQEITKKKILTPDQIFAKFDKVTLDDIKRVANDIFQPEKLNLAVIGPFEDKESFSKILNI